METINQRLAKVLLKDKKLTTYQIARDNGMIPQTVDSWLKGVDGKFTKPSAESVAVLCLKYSLDVSYIMLGVKTKSKKK